MNGGHPHSIVAPDTFTACPHFADFGFEIRGELLAAASDRNELKVVDALLHFGCGDGFHHFLIHAIENRHRRAGRRDESGPGSHVVAREALLVERGDVGMNGTRVLGEAAIARIFPAFT